MTPRSKLIYACMLIRLNVVVALPTPQEVSFPEEAMDGVLDRVLLVEDSTLEGDIVIDSEVIPLVEFRTRHMVRNLVADPRLLWPARTVYYQLPDQADDDHQFAVAVEEALRHIMAVSCVQFVQRPPGQKTYLKLRITGKGCSTRVGYHEDEGVLDLHVGGAKCHSRGTIQHEFLHALGFWHEHTRPDRDKFVSVVWSNIKPDYKADFQKRSERETHNLGLPYDYASVMHYKHTSFAKHRGSPTLMPRNKEAVKVMGQRRGITWVDVAKLNRLYNCSGEYYRGLDLTLHEAVFGKIVESGVVYENYSHNNLTAEISKIQVGDGVNSSENTNNGVELLTKQLFTAHLNPYNNNTFSVYEKITETDDNSPSQKSRRDTIEEPRSKSNSGIPHHSTQNGGNEHFEPQNILPELLKGVLSNDNNERPIVIQFAIYQPVIYRNENNTSNIEESNTKNKSKPTATSDRISNGFVNFNGQKQNIHNIRDEYNINLQGFSTDQKSSIDSSQELNREQSTFTPSTRDYVREHEVQDDHDLRVPSDDESSHKLYHSPSPSLKHYISSYKADENEGTQANNKFIVSDYSEIDPRGSEYSSSFPKNGENSKTSLADDLPTFVGTMKPENIEASNKKYFEDQDFSSKRIVSLPKSNFKDPPGPIKVNNENIRLINKDYNHHTVPSLEISKEEVSDVRMTPTIAAHGRKVGDRKVGSLQGVSYNTDMEDLIKPLSQPDSIIGEDVRASTLKEVYQSLNNKADLIRTTEEQPQVLNSYTLHKKNNHDGNESHDSIPGNIVRDEYHLLNSKKGNLERTPITEEHTKKSESDSDHFTDHNDDPIHHSDIYISSSFNTNPSKSQTEDITNNPTVAKPLPAKSTEIPLDLELNVSKIIQPLVRNGDGENVAPNWKGEIEYSHREETDPVPLDDLDVDMTKLDMPVYTETPESKEPDRHNVNEKGKVEENTMQNAKKRPDIVTQQDKIDELDKDIRRQKLEMKLKLDSLTKKPDEIVMEAKYEMQVRKDPIILKRVHTINKFLSPSPFSEPISFKSKPSNTRSEVQGDEIDPLDTGDDLVSKPNISRVNLNPRQALPLKANATIKMNFRKLFRKERE